MISEIVEKRSSRTHSTQEYRQLRVWQRAMELNRRVFEIITGCKQLPALLSQTVLETALRVPSSIATGYSRGSQAEYVRFMNVARGELAALDTYCMLSNQLGFLNLDSRRQLEILIIETTRLIEQTTEKWQSLL
ncbi:four helix bundle protein [bacterium]|nr:four helix bundle protein [bacterium]